MFDTHDLSAVLDYVRGVRRTPQDVAAAQLGISTNTLRGLERGAGGVRLETALDVLARLGLDVVLVPRDPALSLRDAASPVGDGNEAGA